MKRPLVPVVGHLTRRLFFKIFLAFWVAMTVAGFVLLGVETTRTAKLAQRWRGVTGDALAVYATSAAQDYQQSKTSDRSLGEFLADLEERTRIRAWVFDASGHEISGYAQTERHKQPRWLRERMAQLVDIARSSGHSEFADLDGITLAAKGAATDKGKTLVLAAILPDARYDFWGAAPRIQIMRLLAILVTAGAVSWILARHLTQPLEALRDVTQRLSEGDFTARADSKLANRRDEISDLASDFNGMAAHIERLLRGQNRLLGAQRHLLADVAHELRSPLARSTVALELARDAIGISAWGGEPIAATDLDVENVDVEALGASLNRIERETGNLTELIDRLLIISRLESGFQKPDRTPIDLTALLLAIVADADFEARSRHRQVVVTQCTSCTIAGTSALVRSAIENVVRNALRHTPEDTNVEVSLVCAGKNSVDASWEQSGTVGGCYTSPAPTDLDADEEEADSERASAQWAVITVRDHGGGVAVDELSEIFLPFYRAGSGRPRESGGAGLGLTITARAMELHHGQYRLRNKWGGLEVQLRFPLFYAPVGQHEICNN